MMLAAALAVLLAAQPSGQGADMSALTGWPICVIGDLRSAAPGEDEAVLAAAFARCKPQEDQARRVFVATHGREEGNRLFDGFLARQRTSLLEFLRQSHPAPAPAPAQPEPQIQPPPPPAPTSPAGPEPQIPQ